MIGQLVGIGIVTAHFVTYKQYYWKIISTFSAAYITKRLIKIAGNPDQSDIVGLGGYALTFSEVVQLIGTVKSNGMKIAEDQVKREIIGGLLGQGIDLITELFKK